MKTLYSLLFLVTTFVCQAQLTQKNQFGIRNTYENPISKEKLINATSLANLKEGYPISWVTDYVSSKITVEIDGKAQIATGKNEILTKQQKELFNGLGIGDDLQVEVKYYIENSVTNEKVLRTMNFKASIVPDYEAEFVGGEEMFNKYIEENILALIGNNNDIPLPTLNASFTIDAKGLVSGVKLEMPSEDEGVDQIIIEGLKAMPNWKPAGIVKGKTISQKFIFFIGNAGC